MLAPNHIRGLKALYPQAKDPLKSQLALVLGSATHAFELMLSAFILGLALGALWVRTRVDSGSVRLLAVVQLAMGSLAIATLPVYLATFGWMANAMSVFARSDAGYRLYDAMRKRLKCDTNLDLNRLARSTAAGSLQGLSGKDSRDVEAARLAVRRPPPCCSRTLQTISVNSTLLSAK